MMEETSCLRWWCIVLMIRVWFLLRDDFQDSDELGSGMSNMNIAREEPEFLKQWKVDQEERLKKKDEDEEVMKEKLRLQARQELEDW